MYLAVWKFPNILCLSFQDVYGNGKIKISEFFSGDLATFNSSRIYYFEREAFIKKKATQKSKKEKK